MKIEGQLSITDPVRFLALGDSYTIGASVAIEHRWPVQLADSLDAFGFDIEAVDIIAQTGWTTGNLISRLNANTPDSNYSLVSLLIGVNNQFQGGTLDDYIPQFEELLGRALFYAGNDTSRVFVLSIPDYSYTPFGLGFPGVSDEIDAFNAVNASISEDYGVAYIPVTDISRMGLEQPELVANDGLHPSGQMYARWVDRILDTANLELLNQPSFIEPPGTSIRVFPNPVSNFFQIEGPIASGFKVVNQAGHVMMTSQGANKNHAASHLAPGIYWLIPRSNEHVAVPFVKF